MWPYLNVPEILQMRGTARKFNDTTKYGPYCELFFVLVHHETDQRSQRKEPFQ